MEPRTEAHYGIIGTGPRHALNNRQGKCNVHEAFPRRRGMISSRINIRGFPVQCPTQTCPTEHNGASDSI